jgi:hypothetical protein
MGLDMVHNFLIFGEGDYSVMLHQCLVLFLSQTDMLSVNFGFSILRSLWNTAACPPSPRGPTLGKTMRQVLFLFLSEAPCPPGTFWSLSSALFCGLWPVNYTYDGDS